MANLALISKVTCVKHPFVMSRIYILVINADTG